MEHEDQEENFEEMINHFLKHRKEISEPLTEEYIGEMINYFYSKGLGLLEIEAEKYHIGEDDEGYIIIANMTPKENNPREGFYFLSADPYFKKNQRNKYRVDFVPTFDENEDEIEEAEIVSYEMNVYEVIKKICKHWLTKADI